ncbi:hypothetical protein AAULR_23576, partial [Lacticaseibacillus rhamnosus MTCC 5462]
GHDPTAADSPVADAESCSTRTLTLLSAVSAKLVASPADIQLFEKATIVSYIK